MSEQFKVGGIAVGQNFTVFVCRNGMECEVIKPLGLRTLRYIDGSTEIALAYRVRWVDGSTDWQPVKRLRKSRPPATDEAAARQAMLDCIERAKMPVGVPA